MKQFFLTLTAVIVLFYSLTLLGVSIQAQPSLAIANATDTPTGVPTVPTVPPVDTATATPTATSTVETPTSTATATGVPTVPTVETATPTATSTAEMPTATHTPTATTTPTSTSPTATPTSTPILEIKQYYVSSSSNGKVDNVFFNDEDILIYDLATNTWSIFFDGSDVKVGRTDLDAFFINPDGSILMSFVHYIDFPAPLGRVDDSDIVKFIPTQTGPNTAGTFELYFDGSDVGLTTGSEDIDAFGFTPDGKLLISTYGKVDVPGVSGRDEDFLVFTATSLGENTQGTWALYFDGSDAELTQGSEDVNSLFVNPITGELYMTTRGNYTAVSNNTVSGDYNDIFRCTPQSLGETTVCTFANIFNSDTVRFFKSIDAFMIKSGPVVATTTTTVQSATLLNDELPQYEVGPEDLDLTDEDIDTFDLAQEGQNSRLALPIIRNAPVNPGSAIPLP